MADNSTDVLDSLVVEAVVSVTEEEPVALPLATSLVVVSVSASEPCTGTTENGELSTCAIREEACSPAAELAIGKHQVSVQRQHIE